MKHSLFNKRSAFSLTELLIAIAIIGILASIILFNLYFARSNARDAKRISDMRQLGIALDMYADENDEYPASLTFGEALISPATGNRLIRRVPEPPSIVDGDCLIADYQYEISTDGLYYIIRFCTGSEMESFPSGNKCLSPAGITSDCSMPASLY